MKSGIRLSGVITSIRRRAAETPGWVRNPVSGLWERRHRNRNAVTSVGFSSVAKWIQYGHASQGGSIRYLAVGTGITTPSAADTALVAELLRVEIASWDNAEIDSAPAVMEAHYLFDTDEANGNLAEAALFQNSSGAPMICRGLLGSGSISGATNDDPVVITSVGHGLSDGDMVTFEGVAGMTDLNGNYYYAKKLTDDTFALYLDSGLATSIDGSGFGTFEVASPDTGVWKLIVPKSDEETFALYYALTFQAVA